MQMEPKIKLAVLVVCYTFATISVYILNDLLGRPEEIDWRFWVEIFPQVSVAVLFGCLASNWRQICLFTLTASFIDMIFVACNMYFEPQVFTKAIGDLGIPLFLALDAAIVLLDSFVLFSFGYLISLSLRYLINKPRFSEGD